MEGDGFVLATINSAAPPREHVVSSISRSMCFLPLWTGPFEKLRTHRSSSIAGNIGAAARSRNGYRAVDVELWDAKGKALNTPVYNLLGGRSHTQWMSWSCPTMVGCKAQARP